MLVCLRTTQIHVTQCVSPRSPTCGKLLAQISLRSSMLFCQSCCTNDTFVLWQCVSLRQVALTLSARATLLANMKLKTLSQRRCKCCQRLCVTHLITHMFHTCPTNHVRKTKKQNYPSNLLVRFAFIVVLIADWTHWHVCRGGEIIQSWCLYFYIPNPETQFPIKFIFRSIAICSILFLLFVPTDCHIG